MRLFIVLALSFSLQGAFILHAVVASPGSLTPRATVELLEVLLSRHTEMVPVSPR